MRLRLLPLAAFLLLLCPLATRAQTYARAYGFCEVGGQNVTIQGLTQSSPPALQASYTGCTVNVYLTGTTTHASIYSDKGITPLGNPFTASTLTGYWDFYATVGLEVDVVISGAGLASPFTFGDILVGSATSGGGTPTFVNSVQVNNPNFMSSTNVTFTASGSNITASLVGVPLLSSANAFTGANSFSVNPTFVGNPALAVTGSPTAGHCAGFATSTVVQDVGICSAASLLASNNNWTGTNDFSGGIIGTTIFSGNTYFKSGVPTYDEAAFGAACNGSTNDTSVIATAYAAASTTGGILNLCDNTVWTSPPAPLARPSSWVTLHLAGRLTIGSPIELNTLTCIDGSNSQYGANVFGSVLPSALIIPNPVSMSPVIDTNLANGANPFCAKNLTIGGNFTGTGLTANNLMVVDNVNAITTSNTAQPLIVYGFDAHISNGSYGFVPPSTSSNPSILVEDVASPATTVRAAVFRNIFMNQQGMLLGGPPPSGSYGDCSRGLFIYDSLAENLTTNYKDFLTVSTVNNCRYDVGLYHNYMADSTGCQLNTGTGGSGPMQVVDLDLPISGVCITGSNGVYSLSAHVDVPYLTLTNNNAVPWTGLILDRDGNTVMTAPLAGGTPATLSGCSYSAEHGGPWAGSFVSGISGTCTVTVAFAGFSIPNGWACDAHDLTTPADVINQTAYSTTSITFSGTTVAGDLLTWKCNAF